MIRVLLLIVCGYLLFGNPTARTQTADGLRNIADYIDPTDGIPEWKKRVDSFFD